MLERKALVQSILVFSCACSSRPLPGLRGSDAGAAPPVQTRSQTLTLFDHARISSDSSAPNFQQLETDVDFGAGPYQSVTLSADLGSTCFPFSNWSENPPPAGQNYPADCDAFDRNFEFSLDDPEGDASSTPGLELVRAITPFGGPEHLEHDLTAVANGSPSAHRLRVRINTYPDPAGKISGSNGGWDLSAKLTLVTGAAPRRPLAVIPLFYGDITTTDALAAEFDAPAGTRSAYVEYRTTGHGQAAGDPISCRGPAEEFCQRTHTIQLDGREIETLKPWRTCTDLCTLVTAEGDAGFSYCQQNPCGDIDSVRAPRANWCPGSETPAIIFDDSELATPGHHELSVQLSDVASGGSVHVSLTYFAFAD